MEEITDIVEFMENANHLLAKAAENEILIITRLEALSALLSAKGLIDRKELDLSHDIYKNLEPFKSAYNDLAKMEEHIRRDSYGKVSGS